MWNGHQLEHDFWDLSTCHHGYAPQSCSVPLLNVAFFSSGAACQIGSVTIGSFLVFIMGALVISFTNNHRLSYLPYTGLGLAVASLTFTTLPVMCVLLRNYFFTSSCSWLYGRLFLSIYRKGVFVNMVLVELFWLGGCSLEIEMIKTFQRSIYS